MAEHIAENKSYYDKRFGTLSQTLNEEEQRRWQFISHALSALNLSAGKRIADFGCGRGWLSDKLSAFGNVTGFDLSQKAVENAQAHFKNCDFVCLNAESEIPAAYQQQFEIVVSSEVIEHTIAQLEYLQNCASLLKQGGYLLLTTPNGLWKEAFYQNGREAWKQPVENWLRPDALQTLLQQTGFSIVAAKSFNAEWIFDFRPAAFAFESHPFRRKLLKLNGVYSKVITALNANNKGLNTLVLAKKL